LLWILNLFGVVRCYERSAIREKKRHAADQMSAFIMESRECDLRELGKVCDELGLDSLDFVELIVALDEELEISRPRDMAEKIEMTADLLNAIEHHLLFD